MNYTELVERQEEMQTVGMAMQKESQELQDAKIAFAKTHETIVLADKLEGGLAIELCLDYEHPTENIVAITGNAGIMHITIEDFNQIGGFLQKHNDCIFSYMSEINKEEDDVKED